MLKRYSLYFFYYFLVTYFIQAIGFNLGCYNGVWNAYDNYLLVFTEVFFVYILSLFFYNNNILYLIFEYFSNFFFSIYKFIVRKRKLIIRLSLLFSALFFISGYGNYRYIGSASSSLSLVLIITIFLRTLMSILILSEFCFKKNENIRFFTLSRIDKILIILSLIMSITGVTSAIFLAVSGFVLFLYKKINIVLFFIITPGLLLIIISFGYYIKWGENFEFLYFIEYIFDTKYLNYLVSRISVTFYGHTFLLEESQSIFNLVEILPIQIDNFFYRINYILGNVYDYEKPLFQSINRINYINLANFSIDNNSGVSPGIIPSFKYGFGWFFGLIFSSIYFSFVFKVLNKIGKPSFLFFLLNILFFQSIFKAPLQTLILIDNSTITLISYLIFISFIIRSAKIKINN